MFGHRTQKGRRHGRKNGGIGTDRGVLARTDGGGTRTRRRPSRRSRGEYARGQCFLQVSEWGESDRRDSEEAAGGGGGRCARDARVATPEAGGDRRGGH